MLPIYPAIGYSNQVLLGGSTQPLIFTVEEDANQFREYVVKIFKKKDQEQYNPLSKECFAYALAEEFSLSQPKAAIIEFTDELLEVIPGEIAKRIIESGSRYHYGTQLKDQFMIISQSFDLNDLNSYDIETVFAFDILILNTDRVRRKPNLLVNGKDYMLIDHDHALLFTDVYLQSVKEENFNFIYNHDRLQQHIFVPYLKKLNKRTSLSFDTFDYHLSILNFKKLSEIKRLLDKINIDSSDFERIKEYISELNNKRQSFIKSLGYFF